MNTEQNNAKEETVQFVTLKLHPDYEISTSHPFIVKRKKDEKIMKQTSNNVGYLYVSINGESIEMHRIIAEQFIINDDPIVKTDVDHLNGIKYDNRIENLEWVSHDENCKRRRSYKKQDPEYIDSLDGHNIIKFNEYEKIKLDRYYYDKTNEKIYLKTRAKKSKDGTENFHFKLVKPVFHNNLNIITLCTDQGKYKSYGYNKLMKYLKTL